jgi:Flp pilus assembly pilin Flp
MQSSIQQSQHESPTAVHPKEKLPKRSSRPEKRRKAILRKSAKSDEAGQGLVEYLLLTSLMAVAAMSVVRVMSHSVNAKFAQVTESIQGKDPGAVKFESVVSADYEKRDMSDFMTGATKSKKKEKGSSKSKGGAFLGPSQIEF